MFKKSSKLNKAQIETPLGQMLAIADDSQLYLLAFGDGLNLNKTVRKLGEHLKSEIFPGTNKILVSITQELSAYFKGALQQFKTPLHFLGSPFQREVWTTLRAIPYGQTSHYALQAKSMGREKAYRAVANANGANLLAIVVPCHRVIRTDGSLGGYASGIERKKWLIAHEKNTTLSEDPDGALPDYRPKIGEKTIK
jgi:AraC family transcriptional regulator of adaptative response/methylated-DNA-[protein]-cysteine methyltransferase